MKRQIAIYRMNTTKKFWVLADWPTHLIKTKRAKGLAMIPQKSKKESIQLCSKKTSILADEERCP
jgi:hypothetical protein